MKTLGNLVDHMEKLNEHRSSAKDLHSKLSSLSHFLAPSYNLKSISREILRQYDVSLRSYGNSPSTINAKLCAVKAALKESLQMGWIDKVPEVKLEKIREKVKAVLSDDEVDQMLRVASEFQHAFVVFYLKSGCRANELIEAVNTNGTPTSKLQLMQTKNGHVRTINIDQDCMTALVKLKTLNNIKSLTYKEIYGAWKVLMVRMGWEDKGYTLHTLRHTVITKLARAGIPVHDIQRFIGHKSIETTLKYIHTEVNHTTIMSIL